MNKFITLRPNRQPFPKAIALLALLSPIPAQATNLVDVYQKAVVYDSSLAAAKAAMDASSEDINISRASLLPSVFASASANHTDRSLSIDDNYRTSSIGITLTQPLFVPQAWFALKSSEILNKKSEADFAKAQQDLMLNVATAYFNILRAEENLTTARSAEAAFKRQWEQAKERFDVGLIAITGVLESRASYDASTTRRIQAEGQLSISFEQLGQLTGQIYTKIDGLSEKFPITPLTHNSPDQWVNRAYAQNWSIKAAQYSLQQLQESLKSAKAGHYPTIDLTASYSHNNFTGPSPLNGRTNNGVIGLSLNVPIYQGGGISATIRKTRYLVDQARYGLESIQRNIKVNTRSLLTALKTDIDTVNSRKQNIVSSKSALEATRAGYKVGTRNIVEVLNSEQAYFTALGDYANARFNYVIDSLSIKQTIGTLSPQDLIDLNKWLTTNSK
jgi:outer membrane protein